MLKLSDILDISTKVSTKIKKVMRDNKIDINSVTGMGASGTPTHLVDSIAEKVILKELERLSESPTILSEEAGTIEGKDDYYVIIDPIDGTTNALSDIPFYSTSIAVGKDDLLGIEKGVVRNLVTDDIYYSVKGEGAFYNGNQIFTRKFNRENYLIYIYAGKYQSPSVLKAIQNGGKVRALGSSALEICSLAAGYGDLFYMNNVNQKTNIRVIDIAAASLILREAGGMLFDVEGNILNMPFSLDIRKPIIAVGDTKALHEVFGL
ncbi:MAG: hypothetical protein M1411_03230 [Candidatus Thermoplasmatota archaeon]|nr:hypothetical protein [Candidatus Thermoplasmatota archaeon]